MGASKNPCRNCEFRWEKNNIHRKGYRVECAKCEKRKEHQVYLKSKRKFVTGEKVTSLDDFMSNDWFMWQGRTVHREFFLSFQARLLFRLIDEGCIYKAIRKVESD